MTGRWKRARALTTVFGSIGAALAVSMMFPAAVLGQVFQV